MNYEKLINEFKTPFYAFDIDILKNRIKEIKSHLPNNIELCYAVKANTFIIKEAAEEVERLEVCSQGEFEICEAAKVPMNKIVLSGVYKTPEFIESTVKKYENIGIYTVESMSQYELLKSLSEKYGRKLNVLVRINAKNQFGVTEEEFFKIIRNENTLNIKGIQYFSSTQKNSLKKLNREIDYLYDLIEKTYTQYGFVIEELEYGTGSPVTYFKEESFDEEEYFKQLSALLFRFGKKLKITLEMGRSIAAQCGAYFSKVVDLKLNKAGNFAIIDGGMNHLVYYGQSMAMKHPQFEIYPKRGSESGVLWNICGSLCTINDIVVKALPVSQLKAGDVLIFKNTGAYCMSEGISLFLSRELPAVVMIVNGKAQTVRNQLKTSELNKPNKY